MQKRRHSIWEATLNTASGMLVSFFLSLAVLPMFGFPASAGQAFGITFIFTVVSIVRSYFWRRLFNWLHVTGRLS
jgi:hypothetical protein